MPFLPPYRFRLAEPPCQAAHSAWGAHAEFDEDISAVFPYLNAVLENADYRHEAGTLAWEQDGMKYVLLGREIAVGPVAGRAEGQEAVERLVERINELWENRASVRPRTEPRPRPPVTGIYALLPRTNCGDCAHPTCLAFSAALRSDPALLNACPHLAERDRKRIEALFRSP